MNLPWFSFPHSFIVRGAFRFTLLLLFSAAAALAQTNTSAISARLAGQERATARNNAYSAFLSGNDVNGVEILAASVQKWSKQDKHELDLGRQLADISLRLHGRQMKELCRRFSVSETFRETRIDQLRLMVRALYRYSDSDRGLLDGALYAFASGTNPEALLLLEARQDDGGRKAWHFGFARLGAAMCTARLDDKVVWECPAIEAWDSREPYYSRFGPDAAVFGVLRRSGD